MAEDAIAAMHEDQARKARERAEKCFLAGDVRGARQWMQSAAKLAPALPGTAQIVAAYDVHFAAAKRKPPKSWYAVLGLLEQQQKPGALTHDDVKRQHRKLCLLVHPDKNPSAAADGAFKLIQVAWEELSERHPPGAAPLPAPAKKQTTPAPEKQPQPPPAKKQPRPPDPPAPQPTPPRQEAPPPKKTKEPKPPKQPKPKEPKQPKPKWRPRPREPTPPPRPRPTPRQQDRPRPQPAPPKPKPKQQATRQKPPEEWQSSAVPPPTTGPTSNSPVGNKCPACGACSINSRRLLRSRCGSCQWSPMDNRPADDDDYYGDYFEEDYY